MEEEKYCPFRTFSSHNGRVSTGQVCLREQCALWGVGQCSLCNIGNNE